MLADKTILAVTLAAMGGLVGLARSDAAFTAKTTATVRFTAAPAFTSGRLYGWGDSSSGQTGAAASGSLTSPTAVDSITTSTPALVRRGKAEGTMATRRSPGNVSLSTPAIIGS